MAKKCCQFHAVILSQVSLPAGLSRSVENFLVAINVENINPVIASCRPIFGSKCCYLELKHLNIGACCYYLCHVMILSLKINFKPRICIVQGWWPGRGGRRNCLIWNPVEESGHGIKSLSVFNHCKTLIIPVSLAIKLLAILFEPIWAYFGKIPK